MLHRISEARCAAALRRVVEVQGRVLGLACDPAYPIPPHEPGLRAAVDLHFHGEVALWVWERLWDRGDPARGPSSFQELATAVARHVRAAPGRAAEVLDAFAHDVRFEQYVADAAFRFRFRTLPAATRKVVQKLMAEFYELLSAGLPAAVHQENGSLTVRAFKAGFWEANPDLLVCPCCDREKPDSLGDTDASDADHFFPKSLYPFLSVHPRNLVPTCTECNQRAKRALDPISDHDSDPMLGVYHPYTAQPATDALQVRVSGGPGRKHRVELLEGGAPSPRVRSLVRVWKLAVRWTGRLKTVIGSVEETVRSLSRNPSRMSREDFRDVLEGECQDRLERFGQAPNYILEAAYLAFVLAEPAELDLLYGQYETSLQAEIDRRARRRAGIR